MISAASRFAPARFRTAAVLVAAIAGAVVLAGNPASAADHSPAEQAARTATAVERAASGTGDVIADDSGVLASTAAAWTRVPADAASTVGIALSPSRDAAGIPTANGTVIYPGAAGTGSLAAQALDDGGIRLLVTLDNAQAPTEYRFRLDLPEGATLVRQGETIGAFEAPWAKDAHGAPVPTAYRIEGTTLVQSITVTERTAFPLVADPTWEGMKKRGKAALKNSNKSTVTGAAAGCVVGAISVAGAGCGPGAAVGAVGGFVKGAGEGFIKGK
ncbi:hypothetical protein AB0F18_25925 [Streptomyces sp. NPDC029216]|uniref:hypothetical protein n=1 Tax=Streptomyces sp. NPDC029216 TaxID=3154701 RepID=UPI00340FF76E